MRKYYFHCEKPTHKKAFHKVVGPMSTFSCSCNSSKKDGEPQKPKFDADIDCEDDANQPANDLLELIKPLLQD